MNFSIVSSAHSKIFLFFSAFSSFPLSLVLLFEAFSVLVSFFFFFLFLSNVSSSRVSFSFLLPFFCWAVIWFRVSHSLITSHRKHQIRSKKDFQKNLTSRSLIVFCVFV